MVTSLATVIVPHSFPDAIRFSVSLLGVFLTGANLAFIVYAHHLFPDDSVRFWRLFFGGKALSSLILIYVLYNRHGEEVSWPTIGSAVAFLMVLFALGMIWIRRPYKYVVIRPDLLTEHDRDEVIRNLMSHKPVHH